MFAALEQLDRDLFLALNGLHSPAMDTVMEAISGTLTWIPLYLLIAVALGRQFGWKNLWKLLLVAGLLIAVADQSSVLLFKDRIMRYRPCKNLEIAHLVHNPVGCGGWYGFLSSHATNAFAIAVFAASLLRNRWWAMGLIAWAVLVSYSRIYLGKHYPADLIAGALWGMTLALIGVALLTRFAPSLASNRNAVTSNA